MLAALLPALLLAPSNGLAAAPSAAAAAAPIDRPVVVRGAALEGLLGEPIGSLRLFRWSDRGFVAIPFQIDPRERRARPGRRARRLYVPPPAGRPDFPPGRPLAPDDELVFMRGDLGPAPPAGETPPRSRAGVRIETAGGAVAALAAFDSPPPPSPLTYVHAADGGRRIDARGYSLAFSDEHPGVLEVLRLHPRGAGAGEAPDILDRVKIRLSGALLHALPFRRNEEDIETRVDGVRAGPVRVVRLCRHRVPLVAGLRSPWVEEAQIFYPDGFAFPVWLAKSPGMSRLMTRLSLRVGPDWSPAALGMRVRAAGSASAFEVDGRMDAAERALDGEGAAWSVLYGKEGALFSGIEARGSAAPAARFSLRYRDDRRHDDGPEAHRGEIGGLAYEFPDAGRLAAGEYRWTIHTRVIPEYAPGDEDGLLAAMGPEAPLRVTAFPAPRRRPGGGVGERAP